MREINKNKNSTGRGAEKKKENNIGLKPKKQKNSKANYHSIFEQVSDAIFVTDFDGNFIDLNDSVCRMFNYTKKELLSLNIRALIDPGQLEKQPMDFHREVSGEHIFEKRRMVKKNGDILEVEANVKKFGTTMLLAIVRDITEMSKAQQMLELSEARFRGAFEYSAIGMALVSLRGEWLKVNKELCNMIGYTETELLSLTFQQITHPDDLEKDMNYLQQTLEGLIEFYRMEKRYIHKNGSLVWINLNVSVVKDSKSAPLYFVSQIENITNRKISEEALKKSEANLQVVFDTTDTAYALIDNKLNVISYNKCAADFAEKELGLVVVEGETLILSNYFLEERRPFIEKEVPAVLQGKHLNYEASYAQPDGSIHWYFVRLYPIANSEKEVLGLMLAIDNITKRKEEELLKEKIANDLTRRNKDLEQFAYIVSHNVRAPVARLMGLTSLLTDDYDMNVSEKLEVISGISESAKELDDVIKDLNDILQYKNKN